MPVADVLSVVGLNPMDQAGNPVGTTAQDFVVGAVDSSRQRYLLSPASIKDTVYTPVARAPLCDSILQLLPCLAILQLLPGESVPREHRLTLRKDDQGRVVTHLVAVPQQRTPSHIPPSSVGAALYSCCPTIRMPKLYGGNSEDYGEQDLALDEEIGACDESYLTISKGNLPHPDTWDASITLDRLKGYAQTRDLSLLDYTRKADIQRVCAAHWKQELAKVQRNEHVFVRSPNGESGLVWILGNDPLLLRTALHALNSEMPAGADSSSTLLSDCVVIGISRSKEWHVRKTCWLL